MNAPRYDLLKIFVPLDRETLEPQEESVFLEAFAGHLAGCTLGFVGLEHLEHLVDMGDLLGQLQDTLRPQINPMALQREIQAYRQNPRPWAPGVNPGVWVPVLVPRYTMDKVMAWLYPSLGLDWRTPPTPSVQWRVTVTNLEPEAPKPKANKTEQWEQWRRRFAPRLTPRFA